MTINEIYGQVFRYLEKNYFIIDNKYYFRVNKYNTYWTFLAKELEIVLDIDIDLCKDILRCWSLNKGIGESDLWTLEIEVGGLSGTIRSGWRTEMANGLINYRGTNPETDLTAILSERVAAEINREGLDRLVILSGSVSCEFFDID